MNFGEHLKSIRQQKGLTQKQLAILVGSSERGIQNYEINARKPNFDIIIALADALEVTTDYLLMRNSNN